MMLNLLPLLFALTTAPAPAGVGRLPHITVDAAHHQVRLECQAIHPDMGLEFVCCVRGSHDYESVLRSQAKPSDLHLALLMIGLTPGAPAHYSDDLKKWYPPYGPELKIDAEFNQNGKSIRIPARQLFRDVKTKKPPPSMTWVFTGSHLLDDGRYAADLNGDLVNLLNDRTAVIDVPYVASRSLENRQWEYNPDILPPPGTPMTLIIEPMPPSTTRPTTAPATQP